MKREYCFIVNGVANNGRASGIINKYSGQIQQILGEVHFVYVNESLSIEEAIQKNQSEFEILVICGGDGTLQKAANSAIKYNVTIGYLPIGSGNDFAKTLGLSTSFLENLRTLKDKKSKKCDLILYNNDWFFINTFGIGFDGQANYLASKATFIRGLLRYVLAGFKTMILAEPFKVTFEMEGIKKVSETFMLIVANGKWEGGKYLISPESSPFDGQAELIITTTKNRLRIAVEFIKLSFGFPISNKIIDKYQFKSLIVYGVSDKYGHADGEVIELEEKSSFEVRASQLKLIAPIV